MRVVFTGLFAFLAVVLIGLGITWIKDEGWKTGQIIARQQETIDSLKNANDFLLDTSDTLTIRLKINGKWRNFYPGVNIEKGDRISISYPYGVITKAGSPKIWPSDTLLYKPMKRKE